MVLIIFCQSYNLISNIKTYAESAWIQKVTSYYDNDDFDYDHDIDDDGGVDDDDEDENEVKTMYVRSILAYKLRRLNNSHYV